MERAKKLLANSLHLQELDSSFEQNYGSYVLSLTEWNAADYLDSKIMLHFLGLLAKTLYGSER